jgi:hypothetical protein
MGHLSHSRDRDCRVLLHFACWSTILDAGVTAWPGDGFHVSEYHLIQRSPGLGMTRLAMRLLFQQRVFSLSVYSQCCLGRIVFIRFYVVSSSANFAFVTGQKNTTCDFYVSG